MGSQLQLQTTSTPAMNTSAIFEALSTTPAALVNIAAENASHVGNNESETSLGTNGSTPNDATYLPKPMDGFFYTYALLFVFGCLFNLATLVTLSHASLRGWSTRVLLAALAIVDSTALLMTFLLVLQQYKIAFITGKKSCKFFA